MNWAEHEELSKIWLQASAMYVEAVAKHVRKIENYGPQKAGNGPNDPREGLGGAVIEVVREANESGEAAGLRERFAPAHRPFLSMIEAQGQPIRNVVAIDEERVVAALGEVWKPEGVHLFTPDAATRIEGAVAVARTPDRSHYAVAHADRIEVHEGWMGPLVDSWRMPGGNEGIAPTLEAPAAENLFVLDLRVLPDASGAVVVMPEGVFLTKREGVQRLFPSRESLREMEASAIEDGETELAFHFDMVHAAVHPNGELFAVGAQSSQHELVNAKGERVAVVGPVGSEYPVHASFDPKGELVLLNSCHLYNGVSVAGEVEAMLGMELDPYESDERLREFDVRTRVYASAWVDDTVLLGGAWGYFRSHALDGAVRWDHHVGSTIWGMDLAPGGTRAFVGTAAGFLHVIDLETGEASPFIIGNSTNKEVRRYVCWKGEEIWLW